MEKRKVFKISIIDKEISRTEFDRNTFYTSDSELTLVFKLIERDYSYDHGEILLYNENDESFVTRPITKQENDFVYELDLDIIPHYGKWQAQLQLVKDGDVYTSKPFEFVIKNDLSNLAPQPTLTDINNWSTLKQSAAELIDEMQDIIVDVERVEVERVNQENNRKIAESERSNKENYRNQSELERVSKENKRQQAESERVNNEKKRQISELERVDKENTRQQAESKRQSTFETNETERQTTFESAEQSRQSAELIRVENEKQRNLTSVDEFIKLQDAIGGRNIVKNNTIVINSVKDVRIKTNQIDWFKENIGKEVTLSFKVRGTTGERVAVYPYQNASGLTLNFNVTTVTLSENYTTHYINATVANNEIPTGFTKGEVIFLGVNNAPFDAIEIKIEKGAQATPYTKSPEDYTVVSKDDYYNHIKLMNEFKENQFNQLKKAVIALGGTI